MACGKQCYAIANVEKQIASFGMTCENQRNLKQEFNCELLTTLDHSEYFVINLKSSKNAY